MIKKTENKKCPKCKKVKLRDKFSLNQSQCKSCVNIVSKKYRENNPEKIVKSSKKYRENNKEKISQKRKNHKEKLLQYAKKYRENNKEQSRIDSKKQKEKKRQEELRTVKNITYEDLIQISNIDTIFKVEPPITPVVVGFGYQGVILHDKKEDKLQCHICGVWRAALGSHLKAHKIKSREYKIKFGLPLRYPLVSKKLSQIHSDSAIKNKIWENLIPMKKGQILKRSKFSSTYALTNAAFQNKKGVCEEQILKRFLIVSDIVGRKPTIADLMEYDSKLLHIIMLRFKNLNNFRKHHGFEFTIRQKATATTEFQIIGCLRKFAHDNNRFPVGRDFYTINIEKGILCSYTCIKKVFGSWNRAMIAAGFDIK